MNGRMLGVVHRVKASANGEARPTMVCVAGKGEPYVLKLEDDQAELDFVLGLYEPGQKKGVKKGEKVSDGLMFGDTVVMVFGGSGDRLAFSACRRLKKAGGKVVRIAPFNLKNERGDASKDDDHIFLVKLYSEKPELFTEMADRDMDLIQVRERFFARQDAMIARMGCEQRLRQRFIGQVFLKDVFPEGKIEDEFDHFKANDEILNGYKDPKTGKRHGGLISEESAREKELKSAVRKLPVWEHVFEPLEGVGEMIASRLIVAIGDIRRFENREKLKKFCGVHVMPDGKFARRRNGEVANWHPEARQALYLLGDQFNRRPNSVWGKKLIEYKAKFKAKYPEPVEGLGAGGKKVKKYTPAHIHRMATWRTLTKFVEWLHREWSAIEKGEVERERKAA